MPNQKNKNILENLKEKVARAKSVIFADYTNVKSNDINDLRNKIKEAGGEMSVSKNTLLRIALKEHGLDIETAAADLKGQNSAIFAYQDALSPIKVLVEFAKKLEVLTLKAAFIDGKYNDATQINILGNLPSREVLLARLFGSMKSPITNLTVALSEISKKK